MTITVGENTYVSLADADTYYVLSTQFDAWDALTDDQKERSLATATRMIDRQSWAGTKTSQAQDLQWPRTGVLYANGDEVDPDEVPAQIIEAEILLALMIFQNPAIESQTNTAGNIKHLVAGTAEVEYFRPTRGTRFPTSVQELIGQWLTSFVTASSGGGAAYGTDQCSNFTDRNKYGYQGGIE